MALLMRRGHGWDGVGWERSIESVGVRVCRGTAPIELLSQCSKGDHPSLPAKTGHSSRSVVCRTTTPSNNNHTCTDTDTAGGGRILRNRGSSTRTPQEPLEQAALHQDTSAFHLRDLILFN